MKYENSPIILFTYRRIPKKTIESLLKNSLAKESKLFIFSDGYKNEVDKKDVLEVRKYIKTIDAFKNITIYEAEKNNGLANSVINGVTKIIHKYDKVIVLEDDLIVSDDFLNYMNEALKFYKDDKKVWSISGYGPDMECLKSYNEDIYLSLRGSSWGWATWIDRWDSIDWEIKDWDDFKKDKKAIEKFNLGGNDMYKMLELQMLGKIDSWAIRWCYNQSIKDMYTIYPKKSKIINDGFSDNKGTHNNSAYSKLVKKIDNNIVTFKFLYRNEIIIKCFQMYHNLSIRTKVGYFMKKNGGYKFVKELLKRLNHKDI